jgi:hypothetical protein
MPINPLYRMWLHQIQQLWPQLRITQLRTAVWLLVGIRHARSVHLSKVATVIPGPATLPSHTRRLSRWLDNPAIRVRSLYAPIARNLLATHVHAGEVRLILDGTRVGARHQLLMVALAYRKRALPIAWTWVRCRKGHSSAALQIALLASVRTLLPPGVTGLLVGDTEFEAGALQAQLEAWGWHYVLRQKPNNQVAIGTAAGWQRLGNVVRRPGQRVWLPGVRLTHKHQRRVNVLAYWAVGEKTPWLLATNLPDPATTLRAYRRRMWIEEMFGDLKGQGMDLEATRLHHFLRLSRLTLIVALLYVWVMALGREVIKHGRRRWVDRADRRDLSVFQLGWRYLERCLTNALHVHVRLCPRP